MLIGHYIQKLSFKGRTALPARFKKELGKSVILARWYEGSLSIFNKESWQKIVDQATAGSVVTAPARDTERFLLGGAYEVELDTQGRFVIPAPLRSYADLEDEELPAGRQEVVFVGLGNRVEIWEKQRWVEREKQIIEHAEALLEEATKE